MDFVGSGVFWIGVGGCWIGSRGIRCFVYYEVKECGLDVVYCCRGLVVVSIY